MLLQSHKSFDTVAEYDASTGAFHPFSRGAEPGRISEPISGAFDCLGDRRVLLFRRGSNLYLQIGNRRHPFDHVTIDLRRESDLRVLRVVAEGELILEARYESSSDRLVLAADITPFVEEEDFDFGLFLANLARDTERQKRAYQGQLMAVTK